MRTVADLIKFLQKQPQDSVVVIAKDCEGNNYSPYDGCCEGYYVPESKWDGVFFSGDDLEAEMTVAEFRKAKKAIVFWPAS